jgi:hypothetical protein
VIKIFRDAFSFAGTGAANGCAARMQLSKRKAKAAPEPWKKKFLLK